MRRSLATLSGHVKHNDSFWCACGFVASAHARRRPCNIISTWAVCRSAIHVAACMCLIVRLRAHDVPETGPGTYISALVVAYGARKSLRDSRNTRPAIPPTACRLSSVILRASTALHSLPCFNTTIIRACYCVDVGQYWALQLTALSYFK